MRDLFDSELLEAMLAGKYVRTQTHPDAGLTIYNYTQQTQFERMWNDVTRNCRGLIVDSNGDVVARPFPKFFNLSEHVEADLPSGDVQVTDKLDGSLGILYPNGNGYAVATRGSFVSEQALHATRIWQERYAATFIPNPSWTYLFEIIYPANRIVVDYQSLEDLVLLGAVDTRSGRSVALSQARAGWPGPVVEEFPYRSLEEALAAPGREGREGLVLHFVDTDQRVKVKQDEYVRLHRIVTGVSERRIWEALSEGQDITPWMEAVPDEFHEFVRSTRDHLTAEHQALQAEVQARYESLVGSLPDGWTRKEFAARVGELDWPLARTLFLAHDGRPYDHLLWTQLRPAEHDPFFSRNEDIG